MPRKTTTPVVDQAEEAAQQVVEIVPEVKSESALETFLQYQSNAFVEARKAIESLLPNAVRQHSQKAVEEALEGYRVLVNSVLDEVIKNVEKVKFEERLVEGLEKAKLTKESGADKAE